MRRRNTAFCVSVLSIMLVTNSPTSAQSEAGNDSPNLVWVTLAGGGGGGHRFWGIGGGATASYYCESGLFSVRLLGIGQITVEPSQPQTETSDVIELGGMYGLSYKRPLIFLSASSGLGAVWVMQRSPSGRKRVTTVGIPLDFEAFFTPFRVLGIGVAVSGNINGKQSYAGVFFCLQLGKVK